MDFDDDRYDRTISEEEKINRWNTIHSKIGNRENVRSQYDGWLEKHEPIQQVIHSCKTPIIEFGCGSGQNTLHLAEYGKKVVACDFSDIAIEKIKKNIPESATLKFNMKDGFPFSNNLTEVEIADLCFHYFDSYDTSFIIGEAHRILKPGGHLIIRVNSTRDTNFGSGQGKKLEENFYETRGTTKRFFDKNSLKHFFPETDWESIIMQEELMGEENIRTLWNEAKKSDDKKKILWTCLFKKR